MTITRDFVPRTASAHKTCAVEKIKIITSLQHGPFHGFVHTYIYIQIYIKCTIINRVHFFLPTTATPRSFGDACKNYFRTLFFRRHGDEEKERKKNYDYYVGVRIMKKRIFFASRPNPAQSRAPVVLNIWHEPYGATGRQQ